MKKQIFTLLCACLMSGMLFAQSTWFNDKDLALTGVYYYPEHWVHPLRRIRLGTIGTGRR